MAEIGPLYSFGSLRVKIMLRGVKNVKILTIASVQAVGQISFRFILYLVLELVGMCCHRIIFVGLGSKSSE